MGSVARCLEISADITNCSWEETSKPGLRYVSSLFGISSQKRRKKCGSTFPKCVWKHVCNIAKTCVYEIYLNRFSELLTARSLTPLMLKRLMPSARSLSAAQNSTNLKCSGNKRSTSCCISVKTWWILAQLLRSMQRGQGITIK